MLPSIRLQRMAVQVEAKQGPKFGDLEFNDFWPWEKDPS